jgi:predicted amidophosphoribosyltransferase
MGRCINYTKYAPYPNGSGSVAARRQLHTAMADFINRHPVYGTTRFVTSPPGHKADGHSYGERLGRSIAQKTGKTYIEMTALGERAEQKETSQRDLSDEFSLIQTIGERILIIDDVFHTGATLDAAAKAARRAGATEVITLTAARTLRK